MEYILSEFEKNKAIFLSLLGGLSEDVYLWRQAPEKWNLLEIICHLYDEERDDFRFRTKWVLEHPNKIPPTFNPIDWVTERAYAEQDFNEMLQKFIAERNASMHWLQQLKSPNWDNAFEHPKLGRLSAIYFLKNWLAHDYLHIRQIIKLKFDYLEHQSESGLNYAGTW